MEFAASVTALTSLALEVAKTLHKYSSDVRSSSQDIEGLLSEVDALSKVLKQLELFLQEDEKGRGFDQTVSVLGSTVNACRNTLRDLQSRLQSILGRKFVKLTWPFHKEQLQNLAESLRRYNQVFQFSLTLEGCGLLAQTSDNVAAILQVQLDSSTKLHHLMKDMSALSIASQTHLKASTNASKMLECVSWLYNNSQHLDNISAGLTQLNQHVQDDKDTKILEWLSSMQISQKHHDVRARRTPGTGKWLLEMDCYKAWLGISSTNKVLWCLGGPGAGKTTLMSLVVDDLRSTAQTAEIGIAFFYCDYQAQSEQPSSLALASITRQLSGQLMEFPASLYALYERYRRDGLPATAFELANVLQEVCCGFHKCFILVDAIDEFDVQDPKRVVEFIRTLHNLTSSNTRLFLTSRSFPELKEFEIQAILVPVSAREADIRAYVSRMLEEDEDVSELLDDELRSEIMDKVAAQSFGMFLLSVLQVQSLLGQVTRSDMRQALRTLPSNLGTAYEKTFHIIRSQTPGQYNLAIRALMWVTYAHRPLRIDELRHALATRTSDQYFDSDNLPSIKSVLKCCSGLIHLDNQSLEVRLVHFTLQSYVQSQTRSLFPDADIAITQTCLTYMLFKIDHDDEASFPETKRFSGFKCSSSSTFKHLPFLHYAVPYWGDHAKGCGHQVIEKVATLLLTDSARINLLTKMETTGLHIVAKFGLTSLCKALLMDRTPVDARDEEDDTPLHVAIAHDRTETALMLLRFGADPDAPNKRFATPLLMAVAAGNISTTTCLLDFGAVVNASGAYAWTALHKAADCGHFRITELLLQRGASLHSVTSKCLTALHRAAGRGHVDVVNLLLHHGADVHGVTFDGWTPLHGASSSGQSGVVELLIQRGAIVDHCSHDGKTPLHRASRGGFTKSVDILLRNGASRIIRDDNECLPLHLAARGGFDEVIRLLLQDCPDQLIERNSAGWTAKEEAQLSGFPTTEKLLDGLNSSTFGVPDYKRSHLEVAIEAQDTQAVAGLLAQGINANLGTSNGVPPLHQALKLDSTAIATLLLQRGADVNAKTAIDAWTALHCAALKGNTNSVRLCLEHGALVDARTSQGQTPLHKACQSGNVDSVKLLLQNGAKLETGDHAGFCPIHTAAYYGYKSVVIVLYEAGASLGVITARHESVQGCAAVGGHHALVEFIRDLLMEDDRVRTVLRPHIWA